MARTSTNITFGLFAMKLKDLSSLSCSSLQPFAKLNDLKTGVLSQVPFITLEKNYWLLDGNYKFLPSDTTNVFVGLMSAAQSDENGDFAVPPTLTITFAEEYSVNGLSFTFADDPLNYPTDIDVAYYDDVDVLIQTNNHAPTGYRFSTLTPCDNFAKIIITFNSTSQPYRYLRVTGIEYGDLITFTGGAVKSASVIEEINLLSTELPVSELELNLYSEEEQFDITNPAGDYFDLQNRQPLDVYEVVDGVNVFIGRYFLDTWENLSDKEVSFKAIDLIGVMDTQTALGGMYVAEPVEDLLADLMSAGKFPYALDADLYGIEITGWIPVTTYRQALQQICFAIGAYATCGRNNFVHIKKAILPTEYVTYDDTITKADKGLQQSLTLKPLVTGVELLSHNYTATNDAITLYTGTLAAGSYTIAFSEPAHTLSATNATIVSSGANHANITVASTLVVTIAGKSYSDSTSVYSVLNPSIDPYIKTNVLNIANGTLINRTIAQDTAQRVYDYYQMRYYQKVKLYVPDVQAGSAVLIDTLKNKQLAGAIEKMTLDLSGGFTAQVEMTGVIL